MGCERKRYNIQHDTRAGGRPDRGSHAVVPRAQTAACRLAATFVQQTSELVWN
jgi:hypothetical protein